MDVPAGSKSIRAVGKATDSCVTGLVFMSKSAIRGFTEAIGGGASRPDAIAGFCNLRDRGEGRESFTFNVWGL